MKRVFLFLMIVGLAIMNVFSQKRENRPVSGFTGIDASGIFDVTVTKGSTETLAIEAEDEVMQYVRSEVRNGTLQLYLDSGNKLRNVKGLKAFVTMKDLVKVTLSGVCKLTANDLFSPNKFKSDCSGASKLIVNINTNQLDIEMSGASNTQIKASVSGDVNLNMSGVSKIQGELKATNVTVNSSGVSSIELTGSANNINVDVSGTSKVNAENLEVKNANVKSSGTSVVNVNASDALKVNSSGAASVNYKGSPTLDVSNSRAAKVRKM